MAERTLLRSLPLVAYQHAEDQGSLKDSGAKQKKPRRKFGRAFECWGNYVIDFLMTNCQNAAGGQGQDGNLGQSHNCVSFVTPLEESRDNGSVADDGHTGE